MTTTDTAATPPLKKHRPRFPLLLIVVLITAFLVLAWLAGSVLISAFAAKPDASAATIKLAEEIKVVGGTLGPYLAPVLQLMIVMVILVGVAEKFGFTMEERDWSTFQSSLTNVQAFIAVILITGVVVGALANIKELGVLKDLALVVVGFYFGTRADK